MTSHTNEKDALGTLVKEPVEIDTVKKFIGYAADLNDDDMLLRQMIKQARSLLEDMMGRVIIRRKFETTMTNAHARDNAALLSIPVAVPLRVVHSVEYERPCGESVKCADYSSAPWDGGIVEVYVNEPFRSVTISYESGYDVVPESIRYAVLQLCKALYDRTGLEEVIAQLRPQLQAYWNENI